jgi:YgiT-type zinc finger domain-containing protein
MQCIVCNSPSIEKKQINDEIKINSDIIFIPISIPVCNNCGERYYDRKTKQYLEQTKEKLKNHQLSLKEVGKLMALQNG